MYSGLSKSLVEYQFLNFLWKPFTDVYDGLKLRKLELLVTTLRKSGTEVWWTLLSSSLCRSKAGYVQFWIDIILCNTWWLCWYLSSVPTYSSICWPEREILQPFTEYYWPLSVTAKSIIHPYSTTFTRWMTGLISDGSLFRLADNA